MRRGEVRQYLRDNAIRWLDSRRVDGLRWDLNREHSQCLLATAVTLPVDIPEGWSLMQWIHDEIHKNWSWKIGIAEDLQNNEWLSKDTGAWVAQDLMPNGTQSYVYPLRSVLRWRPTTTTKSMDAVQAVLTHYYNNDAFQRIIYTASHDEDNHGRLPAEIAPDDPTGYYAQKRSTLGAILTLTAPGIPMIFQGQEFLETGTFEDSGSLDWEKLTTFNGIYHLYQDAIGLRRNTFNTTKGLSGQHIHVYHVNDIDKLITYHRWEDGGAGDDVVILANFANRSFRG